MNKLKEKIINNLYASKFYNALINIKELEQKIGETEEVLFLYYFLYDLMEWMSRHKKDEKIEDIKKKKKKYFDNLNQQNKLDTSNTYVKLYEFLDENFNTIDVYSWFSTKNKSITLLDQALKENSDNLEAQFYKLFENNEFEKCFSFLSNNILSVDIVNYFLNSFEISYNKIYLDSSKKLRKKYALDSEQSDFIYHAQKKSKKSYEWLYTYFNENPTEKNKNKLFSYGEVCFKLKKYDKVIEFYDEKENKTNYDFYILGQCYEKKKNKTEAVKCYVNYYENFDSGYWHKAIEKLFKLKAYDEIKVILENDKSWSNKEYRQFYEAKILFIEKKYNDSINRLIGILDSLHNHHSDLKKDIYLLYISNYYKESINYLESSYKSIIDREDFNLEKLFFGLDYNHYAVYIEMKKYIKKLNIEYENKYLKKTEKYENLIFNKYIDIHKKLYLEAKKKEFNLSQDKELYYLSFFDDIDSLKKRIKIIEERVKYEPNNPYNNLSLGKLLYEKANKTDKKFGLATKYLKKSIKLSKEHFINLNGEPELILIKISGDLENNKKIFDSLIKEYLFHNSYHKDVNTMFFNDILYKYKSFSINLLSSLTNNYIYFASPDKLNDPFDIASETLNNQFENLKVDRENFKTFSLSKINDNKLMWSHYTNDHTGISIGYKFLYLPSYVGKEKVKYKNTSMNEKDIFENIVDHWTVKSEDWEYEQEVRLLHYGEKSKIEYTFNINEAIEKNIVALYIDSITFGVKFKEKKIIEQTIKSIEEKQNKRIKILNAKIIKQKLIVK